MTGLIETAPGVFRVIFFGNIIGLLILSSDKGKAIKIINIRIKLIGKYYKNLTFSWCYQVVNYNILLFLMSSSIVSAECFQCDEDVTFIIIYASQYIHNMVSVDIGTKVLGQYQNIGYQYHCF